MEIGLVSCTKSKRDEAAAPRDLYDTSTLFRKARRYCEAHHDAWFVLSAKHGLLDPEGEPVEPYDQTLTNARVAERRAWAEQIYTELDEAGLLAEDVTLVIHAGQAYTGELLPLLADDPVTIRQPLDGLQIGERLAWYNEQT